MAKGSFDPAIFDPAIFDTGEEPPIASINWTGVEERLNADPNLVAEIARRIAELDALVEQAGLTNAEQARAKAITDALKSLVASPEPEWRVIVALLSSPVIDALCNALDLGTFVVDVTKLIVG